nr:unnamed protein product [Spirometra erinaceieuropaei]
MRWQYFAGLHESEAGGTRKSHQQHHTAIELFPCLSALDCRSGRWHASCASVAWSSVPGVVDLLGCLAGGLRSSFYPRWHACDLLLEAPGLLYSVEAADCAVYSWWSDAGIRLAVMPVYLRTSCAMHSVFFTEVDGVWLQYPDARKILTTWARRGPHKGLLDSNPGQSHDRDHFRRRPEVQGTFRQSLQTRCLLVEPSDVAGGFPVSRGTGRHVLLCQSHYQ